MGTNYYRIPTEEEMEARKQTLIGFVNNLELSPENIESGFKLISPRKDWEWFSPWDMFLEDTNVHLGKRSAGWKFCWNFHKDKYYSNKETLLKYIRSGRVIDEYGKLQDTEEFIEMALNWDGIIVDEKYLSEQGLKGFGVDKEVDGLRVSPHDDFC